MSLNNFKDVQAFITQVLKDNDEFAGVGFSPHRAFFQTMSYQQFITGMVPNVVDPATNKPIPILVKGSSAQSAIILSLAGEGPLFDPHSGSIGQMPANGPPMFTDAQVKELADWIDAGCPE